MTQAQPASLMALYENALHTGALRADAAQSTALAQLQRLAVILGSAQSPTRWRWFHDAPEPAAQPQGLYLWGGVGRGKSMLVDLFVQWARAHAATQRVHFHVFMRSVHQRLHLHRQSGSADPLQAVIAEIAHDLRVLCLDEMQVSDVADAMILARLFTGLLDAGVMVLFTSNRAPESLYQGGLQRAQFLAFIALLQQRLIVHELGGVEDYRLQRLQTLPARYLSPLGPAADDFILTCWRTLTGDAQAEPLRLEIDGRNLRVDKHAQGVAWLLFQELCERPLGAGDYSALARACHTLLLQDVPVLTPESRNEAKRFVTLIDTLYEARTKLFITAAAAPAALYPTGDGHFEFARTVSRLIEMQSDDYLAAPRAFA